MLLTYLLTYWLTYSVVQSPSWEANWFATSQEFPRISRNPKVHYRTHKRPPPVSILGQPNPVHLPTSHLLQTHPNIIHPSTPRSPQWSPSLRFPQQDPIHPLSSPYAPHAQPISFFSILSPAQYWVRTTNHLAPRYAISSIPPLPHNSVKLQKYKNRRNIRRTVSAILKCTYINIIIIPEHSLSCSSASLP